MKRMLVPSIALSVFLVFAYLYLLHIPLFLLLLRILGVHPPQGILFLDLRFILASTECWQKGANVYIFNPCDPLGRLFGYSPVWLRLWFLPPQEWIHVVGIIVDLGFISSLAIFPPPKTRRDTSRFLMATLSPPVIFALQRANVDVVIFVAMLAAASLWARGQLERLGAYAIVVGAGLLKFYPIVILSLSIRERLRVFAAICIGAGAGLLGLTAMFYREIIQAGANIPSGGHFTGGEFAVDMFGARNLPDGILAALGFAPTSEAGFLVWFVVIASFTACVIAVRKNVDLRQLDLLSPFDRSLIYFGAAIIVGCFFTGQSAGYRGIFLLFLLPALFALEAQKKEHTVQVFSRTASLVIIFLLWQGPFTWNGIFLNTLETYFGPQTGSRAWIALWLLREFAWWYVVTLVSVIILYFIENCHTAQWLLRQLRGQASTDS